MDQTEGEDRSSGPSTMPTTAVGSGRLRELPVGRLCQVDDRARLAVLLLSPASGVVTGSVIDWDQHVPGAHD